MDGQSVTLTEAEIYPTHLRLNFDYDPANTAWLTELNFYLENERGERFNGIVNGISATGNPDDPSTDSVWLDSPYFSTGGTPNPPCHRGFLDRQGTGAGEGRSGKGAPSRTRPRASVWNGRRSGNAGWVVSFSAGSRWEKTMHYQIWKSRFMTRTARPMTSISGVHPVPP